MQSRRGRLSNLIVVDREEAIERILAELRRRMEEALRNHQRVRFHAREGFQKNSFTEKSGAFWFSMEIDPK